MTAKSYRRAGLTLILLLAFVSFAPPPAAHADIGWPPLSPGGSSLEPQPEIQTNVSMLSEQVTLTVETYERPVPQGQEESPAFWMRALVEAQFTMRNLGAQPESFDVWFPLAASTHYPGMLPYFPDNTIQDFKLWVDGLPTETQTVMAPDVGDPSQSSAWAKFPLAFPAGQDVIVRVNYTLYPSGRRPFGSFEYILQTGAGWKDAIGAAEIAVYLPDTITAENLSLQGSSVEGLPLQPNPAGYEIENNVIRWSFTELEPTALDNIFVDVLEPERYRQLVRARAALQNAPDSAQAQLELARAARGALQVVKTVGQHGGGMALAAELDAAYRRAIELAPERAELYGEYARWLMTTAGWRGLIVDGTCLPDLCDLVARGLEKFPNDPELNSLNDEIRMLQEEAALNATQQALSTATESAAVTPAPTASETPVPASPTPSPVEPTQQPTAASTPTPQPAGPGGLCPFGALPLVLAAGLGMKKFTAKAHSTPG